MRRTWIFTIYGLMSSAWRSSANYTFIKLPPHPDASLHNIRPSPSPDNEFSGPICKFRSRTVTSTPLTRTSVRNGILANPLDVRSDVRFACLAIPLLSDQRHYKWWFRHENILPFSGFPRCHHPFRWSRAGWRMEIS